MNHEGVRAALRRGCRVTQCRPLAWLAGATLNRTSDVAGKRVDLGGRRIICEKISEMCKVAREGAGAILITQEGLTHSGLSILAGLLQDQGPWSDMPLILISGGTDATVPGLTSLRSLSYSSTVTVLERPLRVLTLV